MQLKLCATPRCNVTRPTCNYISLFVRCKKMLFSIIFLSLNNVFIWFKLFLSTVLVIHTRFTLFVNTSLVGASLCEMFWLENAMFWSLFLSSVFFSLHCRHRKTIIVCKITHNSSLSWFCVGFGRWFLSVFVVQFSYLNSHYIDNIYFRLLLDKIKP